MNQFGSDKIFKHMERVLEWQKTGLSRPVTYELDMTNCCNSKCPFCFGFNSKQYGKANLSLKEAIDIIKQIKNYGGKGLTFTGGGEPLCNKSTLEAVKFAKRNGLDIGFITNGILLTDKMADCLVDCCTWIRISLDAGDKETYKITHGMNGETFKKVLNNSRMLIEKKKQRRSSVTIGTGFITFGEVADNMEDFVVLSKKLGVDYAQFRPLLRKPGEKEINAHSGLKILDIIKKSMRHSDDKFKVLCSVHKYENMSSYGGARRAYGACYGHNFAAVVSANKKMYLCCHVRGLEKYCIGDLGADSLENIWKSKQRQKVSENIDFKDCPLLCRCDGFNNILWNICARSEHVNFL